MIQSQGQVWKGMHNGRISSESLRRSRAERKSHQKRKAEIVQRSRAGMHN